MKVAKSIRALLNLNRHTFSTKQNGRIQETTQNGFLQFLINGWKQTFPDDEQQVRSKYKLVKEQKRFTEEELAAIQAEIPEYQRTSLVETEVKVDEQKSKFSISSLIPESLKKKVEETPAFKEFSVFKTNLKEYIDTSDSVAVNIGNKAVRAVSGPSKSARAIDIMRQYDKDFSLMEL